MRTCALPGSADHSSWTNANEQAKYAASKDCSVRAMFSKLLTPPGLCCQALNDQQEALGDVARALAREQVRPDAYACAVCGLRIALVTRHC